MPLAPVRRAEPVRVGAQEVLRREREADHVLQPSDRPGVARGETAAVVQVFGWFPSSGSGSRSRPRLRRRRRRRSIRRRRCPRGRGPVPFPRIIILPGTTPRRRRLRLPPLLFPRPPRPRLQRHVLSHAPESVPQKIAPAQQRRFLRIPRRVVARAPQQREQVVQGPIQRRGRPDRSRVRARVHRPRELLHREGRGGAAFSVARIYTLERVEVRILRSEPSLLCGAHRLARRPQRRRGGGGAGGRRGGGRGMRGK